MRVTLTPEQSEEWRRQLIESMRDYTIPPSTDVEDVALLGGDLYRLVPIAAALPSREIEYLFFLADRVEALSNEPKENGFVTIRHGESAPSRYFTMDIESAEDALLKEFFYGSKLKAAAVTFPDGAVEISVTEVEAGAAKALLFDAGVSLHWVKAT